MSKRGNYADAGEERRRSTKGKAKDLPTEKEFRWCNVSLPSNAKEVISGTEFDAVRVFEFLEGLVHDQYKVTLGRDVRSDCFMVIVVGRDEARVDYNVGVSSRHSELEIALLTTQYKFEVLFMGGSIPSEALEVKSDVWD